MNQVVVLFPGNERGGAATHIVAYAKAIQRAGLASKVMFLALGRGPLHERIVEINPGTTVLDGPTRVLLHSLRKLMNERPGSVLWHLNGPRLNVLGYFAARQTRASLTSTVHSHPRKDFMGNPWKTAAFTRFNLHCLRSTAGLFVGNRSFSALFPNHATFYVPNAIEPTGDVKSRETNRQFWRNRFGISAETPLVGVVARFDMVKDIPTTIRALALLDAPVGSPVVHLALAGDGAERARLEAVARSAGVANRVHFAGFVDDVSSFYDAIDVHVTSSLSEGESPYVVLEAGMRGVVTVGSDIAGTRNLIESGVTGLLFPPADTAGLAEGLRRVLYEPNVAGKLARQFSDNILPQFSLDAMLAAYLHGYQAMGVQFDGGEHRCR